MLPLSFSENNLLQTLTPVIIFVLTIVLVKIFQGSSRKKLNLPPGPSCLPILGFHPFLTEEPHLALHKLQKKFGSVFGLMIGTRYCVVLSDFKSIKESYNKTAFLSRPPNYFRVSPVYPNIADMSGKDWEDQRKFSINTLKSLGMGRNRLGEILVDEISRMIPKMTATCQKNPEVNLREVITPAINNAIFQLICSRWFDDDHPVMKNLIVFQHLAPESFLNTSAPIFFPWFKWFLLKFNPRLREIWISINDMESYMRTEIAAHEKSHTEDSNNDYIDYFLSEIKRANGPTTFNKDILTMNAIFLLQAGSETVRNTLEWSMLCMAEYPEVQEKVYQEIISVLGAERGPTWDDKGKLPYTEAVILETERWKTLVVLNCLRWTSEDTTVQGFDVPQGTIIINNLWACHMDPEYWEKPEEFRPERFLSKDGLRAITPEYFMTFSFGRRDCPGDKMAIMEVFLYFTAIMQRFHFSPPSEGISFEHFVRINVFAKKPVARVTLRQ